MPTTWTTHLGKRVLYTDFRECKKTLINTYSVLTGVDARAFDSETAALVYLVSK